MAWRYIAQRALTGEFLDWDVPLRDVQITHALSGPDGLSGTLSPECGRLLGPDGKPLFDEWSTILYAEADGQIRCAGILTHSEFSDAGEWSIECTGFAGYPKGIPYLGNFSSTSVDPLVVVREIWNHVQAQPDGSLGVFLDSTTSPVRIGSSPKHVAFTTDAGEAVSFDASQAYQLVWWEAPDCGDEIDNLAQQTPFDYREAHKWLDDGTIEHRIRLGYPRLGRRRNDLRFVLGENLGAVPTPTREGDEFANEVYGVGKGEGSAALHVRIPQRDGRLRRCYVFTNSSAASADLLTQLARQELARRNPIEMLDSVVVRDHPNAPLGSWDVGDDILVQGELPWLGSFSLWCRITSETLSPDSGDAATLTLQRSDSFTYGGITT